MRWLCAVTVVLGLGCLRPVAEEPDGGPDSRPVAVVDAGRDASVPTRVEEYDPCVWDGQGAGFCFADSAYVFDGLACRAVCGPTAQLGRPGVFRTISDCYATCPCEPDKFVLWPGPMHAGPFELGGFCDELIAVTDGGADPPWPELSCGGNIPFSSPTDQLCHLGVDNHSLDRRALSRACRASMQPQVRQVGCLVWID